MAVKKDNRPINADENADNNTGVITYANEVVAIMAGVAASEVEGIAGMCTSGGLADIIGRNRNITRGVKVEVGTEEASVDLYVIMEYGKPIQKACSEVQENVRKNIESMTGLHVVRVDVHVQGVSFEKENRDAQRNLETGKVPYIAPVTDEPQSAEMTAEEQDDQAPVVQESVTPDPDAAETVISSEEPCEPDLEPEAPVIAPDDECVSQPDETGVSEYSEDVPAEEPSIEAEASDAQAEESVADAEEPAAEAEESSDDAEESVAATEEIEETEETEPKAKQEKSASRGKAASSRKKKPSETTQESC